MSKLHSSIQINASVEKVWEIMLEDVTYREWTASFMPGSYFVGDWTKGSKIQFLGPDETGKIGGMTSEIAENRKYEFISIHHLGMVGNGIEDTTSEEAKKWQGYENYTFKKIDNGTELLIDQDVPDAYKDYFQEAWSKSLQKIKELCEA